MIGSVNPITSEDITATVHAASCGLRLRQPRPQGLLLDDFQNGGENRRGEGPGDEVDDCGALWLLNFQDGGEGSRK